MSMENLTQSPLDGSSSDGTSTLAVPMRSLKQATVIPSWKSIEDLSEEKGSSACSPCSCAQHENQVYQLTVGKDSWIESYDALIYPVDTVFDEGNNVYKLRTKSEEIYKAWKGDQ